MKVESLHSEEAKTNGAVAERQRWVKAEMNGLRPALTNAACSADG